MSTHKQIYPATRSLPIWFSIGCITTAPRPQEAYFFESSDKSADVPSVVNSAHGIASRAVSDKPFGAEERDASVCTLSLTEAASAKLSFILSQRHNEGKALRFCIDPGGCQGYQYRFSLDVEDADSDVVLFHEGYAKVIGDRITVHFLNRCEVDYVTEVLYSGFKVTRNAVATSVCSCGGSFDAQP